MGLPLDEDDETLWRIWHLTDRWVCCVGCFVHRHEAERGVLEFRRQRPQIEGKPLREVIVLPEGQVPWPTVPTTKRLRLSPLAA